MIADRRCHLKSTALVACHEAPIRVRAYSEVTHLRPMSGSIGVAGPLPECQARLDVVARTGELYRERETARAGSDPDRPSPGANCRSRGELSPGTLTALGQPSAEPTH